MNQRSMHSKKSLAFWLKSKSLKLLVPLALFLVQHVCGQGSTTQFPYFLSLQEGNSPPAGVYLPGANNKAKFTKEGLFLTELKQFQFGAILLQDLAFNSNNGLDISFEFNIYNGDQVGTDGILMFLYDGAIPNNEMHMGATGRSLGYVFSRAAESSKSKREKGVPGAYLGVGINISGNFKVRNFGESARMNGTDSGWPGGSIQGASHITLRGAELKLPKSDPYSGYRGYTAQKDVWMYVKEGDKFKIKGLFSGEEKGVFDDEFHNGSYKNYSGLGYTIARVNGQDGVLDLLTMEWKIKPSKANKFKALFYSTLKELDGNPEQTPISTEVVEYNRKHSYIYILNDKNTFYDLEMNEYKPKNSK